MELALRAGAFALELAAPPPGAWTLQNPQGQPVYSLAIKYFVLSVLFVVNEYFRKGKDKQ